MKQWLRCMVHRYGRPYWLIGFWWWRELWGGHWEKWYMVSMNRAIEIGERPVGCFGEPRCEDYETSSRECIYCGSSPARHRVTLLTVEQKGDNLAWGESFKGGVFHTGHCPHLELPTYACTECYEDHPEAHLV